MKTWQLLKANPQLWDRYFVKEKIIRAVREFFENINYHELESPILAPALPQEHYLNPITANVSQKGGSEKPLYLIPSTERYNKIALAAGIGEHFVISKVFRGIEEISSNHSPEFTMLEWYHLNANYIDLMQDCEDLIRQIINKLDGKLVRNYQGEALDFSTPFERLSVVEALKKYSNIEIKDIQELGKFRELMLSKGYKVDEQDDWELMFELLFANEIETELNVNKPTFVYDYPKQLCPLTKINSENILVCEKVELYIAGKEIANGYSELLNGEEQEKRFHEEAELRKALGKDPITFDYEMVEALKSGIPNATGVGGIGLGLDRLTMLLADCANISDINLFPGSEIL